MTIYRLVRIGRNLITTILLYGGIATPAVFAEARIDSTSSFEIHPQALPSALLRYTEQSGVQVTSAGELVERKFSRGAIGQLNARSALSRLLEGTALAFETIDDSSVIIVPARTLLDPGPGERRALSASNTAPPSSDEHEVVVTGSHIRGAPVHSSPVYSFDRLAFASSGLTSIQEFLRATPINFGGGRTEASGALMSSRNGGRDNLTQGAGINIRGLGNESTLVLMNGHRMAGGGFGSYADVSAIPLSAIERIDVLADGSSALYGSDAIAGVVNIILRDEFDGAETSLRYGGVTSGSLRDKAVNQVMGRTWGEGSSWLVNVDYGDRGSLPATERPYAAGLSRGQTDLLPSEERISILTRGQYAVSENVHASLDAYINLRDAEAGHFQSVTNNQLNASSTSELTGGTAEIGYLVVDDWKVTVAHTYSNAQNSRSNDLGIAQSAASTVFVDLTVSATEIKASGTAFRMPGGMSQLAVGAERREESMNMATRNHTPLPDGRSTFHRDVEAAYAELQLPLLSRSNDGTQSHQLGLSAAFRYENYTDVGKADTKKFGFTWSPTSNLSFRGSWGTSFRAPYLYQYYGAHGAGIVTGVPNANSPTGTTLLGIAAQAPHPDLGPETATTWTAGLSFGGAEIDQLQVATTYFQIDYRDRIDVPVVSLDAFNDPRQLPLISMPADPEVLEYVGTAPLLVNPGDRRLDEVEATLDGRTRNRSRAEVSGVDLLMSKQFEMGLGAISAGISATYFIAFDTSVNESSASQSVLDTIFNPVDFRARGQLTWSNPRWSVTASLNYTDDYTDNQRTELRRVSSWTTIDLSASYTFPAVTGLLSGLNIRASLVNAGDKDPPRILDIGGAYGDAGFDSENANALGRSASIQIVKRW